MALAAHHPHAAAITSMPSFLMARDVTDILDACTAASSHPCHDVGRSACCPNQSYCVIVDDDRLGCCRVGVDCREFNSRCDNLESYQCVITTTRRNSESLVTTCCPRSCTGTSQYLCPSSLGGQCCGYDEACRSGGECEPLSTPAPPPTTSPTSSIPTATETDTDSDSGSSGGLSDAETAGVAAGSVVGGGLLIACAVWFFVRRRRRRLHQEEQPTQRSAISMPSRTGEELVSDITAPTSRPGRSRTGTQGYFGPDPVTGPFTETEFSSPAGSPGISRAVPSQPQTPGDIAAPIEIDSLSQVDRGRDRSPSGASVYATPVSDTIDGRVELHSPSMYSGEFRPTPRSDPWQQR
ncbi:hypothetical protein B0I35DRAFT_474670 [Stachybotrys elegans]|uniref:Extracellular membrane protein CFEM domain-containing protein n=1 Tax=Stachybotrys elegans TaxID=80388 RepID=A0A8K0WUR8_9HYPO|nr:hypothetical protein B0I35DRAFT_474670 [Stachybotrys elegans]